MQHNFVRQTDKPLFPEVFWNRPTMAGRAGRLLIVGGHKSEFSLVQNIYQIAEAAGIGSVEAAFPDVLQKTLGGMGIGHFLPSTASGSLGRAALGELLHLAEDADGIIVGANLTNNAETAILIESLLDETDQPVIITEETVHTLKLRPDLITGNPRALVITSADGLFDLANYSAVTTKARRRGPMLDRVTLLHDMLSIGRAQYVVHDKEYIYTGAGDKVSVTPLSSGSLPIAVPIGVAATFWLQQRGKAFEALTTAAYVAQSNIQEPIAVYEQANIIRKVIGEHDG